jgi:ariadne-1
VSPPPVVILRPDIYERGNNFLQKHGVKIASTPPPPTALEQILASEPPSSPLVLPPESYYEKYLKFLYRSFVDDNSHIKWCPAPGCQLAIDRSNTTYSQGFVRCVCGWRFCFNCEREDHSPVSCDQMNRWSNQLGLFDANMKWLMANTKSCPKCQTSIQLNKGCNHVECKKCAHQFCWVCLGSWAKHGTQTGGFYSCNRFEASKVNALREKAKGAMLERNNHYMARYLNHGSKGEYMLKQVTMWENRKTQVAAQMNQDQQSLTPSELRRFRILVRCYHTLVKARRLLRYSYVFAFFFSEGTNKENAPAIDLFETLQQSLEAPTEELSHRLDKPFAQLNNDYLASISKQIRQASKELYQYIEAKVLKPNPIVDTGAGTSPPGANGFSRPILPTNPRQFLSVFHSGGGSGSGGSEATSRPLVTEANNEGSEDRGHLRQPLIAARPKCLVQ